MRDSAGLTATAPAEVINVLPPPPHTNQPSSVRISSPPNAAVFHTPVNIPIYAYAYDSDGVVTSVEFKAGTNSLGFGGPVVTGTNDTGHKAGASPCVVPVVTTSLSPLKCYQSVG